MQCARGKRIQYSASGPSQSVSKNIFKSSSLISRTLVSKDPWRVRALQRSFASRKARPNSLQDDISATGILGEFGREELTFSLRPHNQARPSHQRQCKCEMSRLGTQPRMAGSSSSISCPHLWLVICLEGHLRATAPVLRAHLGARIVPSLVLGSTRPLCGSASSEYLVCQ
jgi:hypothetical protein